MKHGLNETLRQCATLFPTLYSFGAEKRGLRNLSSWEPSTHLEEVQLVVVEDTVVVQVRHFKDASQGFNTQGLHLENSQTIIIQHHFDELNEYIYFSVSFHAYIFSLRAVERAGGVEDSLLRVVEQLRNVLQVLRWTLEVK